MKVDLQFYGNYDVVDTSFIRQLLVYSSQHYFNAPECLEANKYNEIVHIIKAESYIDLAFSLSNFDINGRKLEAGFANFTKEDNKVELLIFMEMNEIIVYDLQEAFLFLRSWSLGFYESFKFHSFKCSFDNGNVDEYYFDQHGLGPLF